MNPYLFGQYVKRAVDATKGIRPAPMSFAGEFFNPPKPAANSGAPTSSPYVNTLDRWYNPNTQQKVTEQGEKGLMRTGQVATGIGAGATAALGGMAAAPAIAAAGNTTMAGLGTVGAGIGSQAPRITQALGNAAGQITSRAPNIAQSFQSAENWIPATNNAYAQLTGK